MNKISDIDEVQVFVQNLTNIIEQLRLNKSKLNKKLRWPTNKLRNILEYSQAPLLEDAKDVRKLLRLKTVDFLLSKLLDEADIDNLSETLADVKLIRNTTTTSANKGKSPVSYIIVLLHRKYTLEDEFTKKDIITSIPSEFAKYSIEWEKNRLNKYVEKAREITNSENKSEHVFKLTQILPLKMVEKAVEEVGDDWLEGDENNKEPV